MIYKIQRVLRRDGFKYSLVRSLTKILKQPGEIEITKQKVLSAVRRKYGSTVAYGPFAGMKLGENAWWGKYDAITKILGVYEGHVVSRLLEFGAREKVPFVDIGAADGYFAVGMAFSKRFKHVYAFEISEQGRESLHQNVRANDCQDAVTIRGEADHNSLTEIVGDGGAAVVLIDIEGAEFDLLDVDMLEILRKCYIICELHPWLARNGLKRQEGLIRTARTIFDVSLIKRDSYNPNQFSVLDDFTDEERLIAFGEGRGRNMQWLVLQPKA